MSDIRDLEIKHLDEIDNIIRAVWKQLPMERTVELSTEEEDTKLSFDIAYTNKVKISVRIRENEYLKFKDLTIRSRSKHGNETEIDKLKKGHGSFYLYAWLSKDKNSLEEWMVVDINKLRPYLDNAHTKHMPNGDGTEFDCYSIPQLRAWCCGIASSFALRAKGNTMAQSA